LPSPPVTGTTAQIEGEKEPTPDAPTQLSTEAKEGKIVKKRKASGETDEEYKPVPTDSDYSLESEHETKRNKRSAATPRKLRRNPSSRVLKKKTTVTQDEIMVVVPDGVSVPPIPSIPNGVEGKKAKVTNGRDAYGGLEHEMF
jgi:hypothetical protein